MIYWILVDIKDNFSIESNKWLWQRSQLIQRWWRRIYEHSENHWWFSYSILEQIMLIDNSINHDLTDLSL